MGVQDPIIGRGSTITCQFLNSFVTASLRHVLLWLVLGPGVMVYAARIKYPNPDGELGSQPVGVRNLQTANGVVAQLGERLPCTQNVAGSIPVNSTMIHWARSSVGKTPRSQREVAGSTPAESTIFG